MDCFEAIFTLRAFALDAIEFERSSLLKVLRVWFSNSNCFFNIKTLVIISTSHYQSKWLKNLYRKLFHHASTGHPSWTNHYNCISMLLLIITEKKSHCCRWLTLESWTNQWVLHICKYSLRIKEHDFHSKKEKHQCTCSTSTHMNWRENWHLKITAWLTAPSFLFPPYIRTLLHSRTLPSSRLNCAE